MESANTMKLLPGQPQSMQTPQRKCPRTTVVSPLQPSPESSIANSSQVEVETGTQEATQKAAYEAWTEGAQAQLFQWLEVPGNYDKWKCAGVKTAAGTTKTSGLTKKAVTRLISQYLETLHTKKTSDQVMSKMRYVEKKFKQAEDFLRNTGEGLTTVDEKMGITAIRSKVLLLCPFYYQVKPFMSDSAAVNPPYIGETGINENFEAMLFGTNTGEGLFDSIYKDGGDLNSEDEDSSEEHDCDNEMPAEQEPSRAARPEVASEGVRAETEAMQSTCTPNREPKEKKKKPKSLGESIQDMQEQNRILMEKRLALRSANQTKKMKLENQKFMLEQQRLQFIREESVDKHKMESRRLDLEFLRMDKEREETRNRQLALEIELEKLRARS